MGQRNSNDSQKQIERDNRRPVNADANKSIGRPGKVEDIKEDLVQEIFTKYDKDDIVTALESLVAADVPIKGLAEKLDADYFVRKFLQIGLLASKPYDRTLALEKAARICGHIGRPDPKASPGVNITFETKQPAEAEFDRA